MGYFTYRLKGSIDAAVEVIIDAAVEAYENLLA